MASPVDATAPLAAPQTGGPAEGVEDSASSLLTSPSSLSAVARGSSGLSAPPSSSPFVPAGLHPPQAFLISFPRSGNSLLRKLLEDATGVLTGSHYQDRTLFDAGLRGEMNNGANTLLVKHHFLDFIHRRVTVGDVYDPTDPRRFQRYRVERYVYAVRNPLDSLVSYWMYAQHWQHEEEVPVDIASLKAFIRAWLPTWAEHVRFFQSTFLLRQCTNCSTLVVKYEELVRELEEGAANFPTAPSGTILPALLSFLSYPAVRPCRAARVLSKAPQPYALKMRRSLLDHNVSLPRSSSYGRGGARAHEL